ncbi:MAG: HAD family hydrolase [Candidatus Sericytochromatia bacterium]|nr:HAD family hydrolase [Candidatus Tanganyikabacteria bacterium]
MPSLRLGDRVVSAEAIVFDKDGVLEEFQSFWGAVTELRAEGLGFPPGGEDHAELCALLGYPAGRVDPDGPLVLATAAESAVLATGYLYRKHGVAWPEGRSRVARAFAEAFARVPPAALRACPDVLPALAALRAAGWRLGVATTDSVGHARETFRALGLDAYIEAVAGGDEVARGKPDPEMYHRACERLGVRPEATVVVGDGINDLLMGRNAGCAATIGVLSGVSDRAALEPAADCILGGVRELPALAT